MCETAGEARKEARKLGWIVIVHHYMTGRNGRGWTLCPEHRKDFR
jgi:hypothetical protein